MAARRGAVKRAAACALALALLAAPARATDDVERAGDVLQFALPAAGAALALVHRDGEGARQLAKSFAVTMILTFALKYAVDAERPNGGGLSFPSGHTAAAFAGAGFVARRYGWRLGVPATGAAAFVAFSRVDSENHHVRDVVAAAGLALASAFALATPLPLDLEVTPQAGDGVTGLLLRGRW